MSIQQQQQHIDLSQPIPDSITDESVSGYIKAVRELKLEQQLNKNVPKMNSDAVSRKEQFKAITLASMQQRGELYRENKGEGGGFIIRKQKSTPAKLTLSLVKSTYAMMHQGDNARKHAEQFAAEIERRMLEHGEKGKETLVVVDQLPTEILMEQMFRNGEQL